MRSEVDSLYAVDIGLLAAGVVRMGVLAMIALLFA